MATRKRRRRGTRRASARRNPINPVNPTRRRRATRPRRRGRRSAVYARRRNPINPTRRRRRSFFGRRRRRRNPVTGIFGRAVPLVIGSAAVGLATPFVSQFVVRFAPQLMTTPVGVAATTFGTGWALSALARMFAFTRRWADDVLLAGAVLAGGQLFTAYVAPMIRLNRGNNGMGRRGYGMRGIGLYMSPPPGMAALPPPPANNGMQGVGMYATPPMGFGR